MADNNSKEAVSGAQPIFSWQSPEFVRYKKSNNWFVGVIGVSLVLAGLLYWQDMLSGAIVVIAAAAVLVSASGIHPKNISMAVYQDGVLVDGRAYRFDQFKSFSMSFGEIAKAKLDLIGKYTGEIVLPLKNIDPEQIRLYLKKHLPEEESKGEDLMEMINRIIRF